MKIPTEIAPAAKCVGEQKTLEYMGKAGFDAWDFSVFSMCRYDYGKRQTVSTNRPLSSSGYLRFARELKQPG